jgi:hypothetical protein
MHTIRIYDLETMKPLDTPFIKAEFSASQICHPMSQMHIRGHYLAITCEGNRDQPDRLGFSTRLIHWRTGREVLEVISSPCPEYRFSDFNSIQ